MPDDHSEVVPLLPIPNRTVKRLCANDSADSRVKVGHRQAPNARNAQSSDWAFFLEIMKIFKKSAKSVVEYKASLITVKQASSGKSCLMDH